MKEFTTIQQLAEAILFVATGIVITIGLMTAVISNQIAELKELIKNKGNG